jgi:hypothetical protein
MEIKIKKKEDCCNNVKQSIYMSTLSILKKEVRGTNDTSAMSRYNGLLI